MTQRSRQRLEAALVLLAFPLAIGLTVLVISGADQGVRASGSDDRVARILPDPALEQRSRVAVVGGAALRAFGLADSLAAAGYEVVAVGPDENSLGSTTEVVYYQRADRSEAEKLRDILGVGTIRREQVFSPSSDMTIIIGKDLQST